MDGGRRAGVIYVNERVDRSKVTGVTSETMLSNEVSW